MITLEINSSVIRVIEVDDRKIMSWASRMLEPGIFIDGMVADSQGLSRAIKDLLKSSTIKGKKAVTGISGLYSLNRVLVIPTPPATQLTTETVIQTVENLLPVAEEDIYLSWATIGNVEGGQQIIVHTSPREIMDTTMQAIRSAGISTSTLDLTPMAIARSVNSDEGLILNIENDSIDIIIIIDGLAEVIRTTGWKHEDMSPEEKIEYLVSSVEMTQSFYESSRPGFTFRKTTPLYITGQMSGDAELVNSIRDKFDFTEGIYSIPFEYPEDFPLSEYAATVGLAMKGMGTESGSYIGYLTPDINMLPQRYKPWRPTAKQTYAGLAFMIALALLFPVYQTTFAKMEETEQLEFKYDGINQLLILRQTEISKREPLKQVVTEWGTITGIGDGIVEDYILITGLAEKLDISLSSITHSGATISFSCVAESYEIFREFIDTLEMNERFTSLTTPLEGYPFYTSGDIQLQVNS